jgi:cytochrome P450
MDPETGKLCYSVDELFGESEMLIIAGADTTAISTAATFFYLAHNLNVQEKLAREIAATFPSVADIRRGLTLSGCKYLQASFTRCCV